MIFNWEAQISKAHLYASLIFFKTRQVGAIVTRVRELDTRQNFDDMLLFLKFIHVCLSLRNEPQINPFTWLFIVTIPLYIITRLVAHASNDLAVEEQFTHAANTSFLTETMAGSETLKKHRRATLCSPLGRTNRKNGFYWIRSPTN